jgi:uncharacterized membrane protein
MRTSWTVFPILFLGGGALGSCSDSVAPSPRTPTPGAVAIRDLGGATFTTLLFPGATGTFATDINEEGDIVGRYAVGARVHGFLRDASGAYTSIDYPGSSFSVAGSINDEGDIVGWYSLPASPSIRHGFLLKDGVFTSFDPPGSTFTNPLGIDERGDITGRFCTLASCTAPGTGDFHGFFVHDGEITMLNVPNAGETNPFKLAPRGDIVGGFDNAGGPAQLFVLSNGNFSTFELPNGKSIAEDNGGTNARGDIVGTYCDAAIPCLVFASGNHGFLLSEAGLATIDVPGASATSATGINARGDIVGGYVNANGQGRGFLLSAGR